LAKTSNTLLLMFGFNTHKIIGLPNRTLAGKCRFLTTTMTKGLIHMSFGTSILNAINPVKGMARQSQAAKEIVRAAHHGGAAILENMTPFKGLAARMHNAAEPAANIASKGLAVTSSALTAGAGVVAAEVVHPGSYQLLHNGAVSVGTHAQAIANQAIDAATPLATTAAKNIEHFGNPTHWTETIPQAANGVRDYFAPIFNHAHGQVDALGQHLAKDVSQIFQAHQPVFASTHQDRVVEEQVLHHVQQALNKGFEKPSVLETFSNWFHQAFPNTIEVKEEQVLKHVQQSLNKGFEKPLIPSSTWEPLVSFFQKTFPSQA
jgi:predicted Fe-Mo cluster-binding NifX family protein